jgi:RNA polymerase sigma factor (sigma-70 family)
VTAEIRRLGSNASDPPLSDEALARACAGGDAAAIAALFDRFGRPIARYLRRLLGAETDVDDLLQATFVEIARGSAVYDSERGNVLVWLFSIATNLARHHRRSVARRHRLLAAVAHAGPSHGIAVGEQVQARRDLEAAGQALAALADEQREAFVLCELEGLSARAAAQVLGANESLVWKRVSDARRRIREHVLGGRR